MSQVEVQWLGNDVSEDRQFLEDELTRKHTLFRDIPILLTALDGKFGETSLKIWLNTEKSQPLRGCYYVECWRDRTHTQFLLIDADTDTVIAVLLFKDVKCVGAEQFEEYGKTILSFFKEFF